jgi:hypothetical protein
MRPLPRPIRSSLLLIALLAAPGCPIRHRPPPPRPADPAPAPPDAARPEPSPPTSATPAARLQALEQRVGALERQLDALRTAPSRAGREALLADVDALQTEAFALEASGDASVLDALYPLLDRLTLLRDAAVRLGD